LLKAKVPKYSTSDALLWYVVGQRPPSKRPACHCQSD